MHLAHLCFAARRWFWTVAVIALLGGTSGLTVQPLWAFPFQQQTTPAPVTGVISATARVNLRGGPGTQYLVIAKVDPDLAITVLSTSPSQDWLRVRVTSSGRTGWISSDLVQLRTDEKAPLALLPTPTPDAFLDGAAAKSSTDATSAASEATHSTQGDTTTTKRATIANVTIAKDTIANDTTANDTTASDVSTTAAITTSAVADTASGAPRAITRPASMNVRGGPGTNYPVVTTVRAGTALPILALGPNGDWYKVEIDGVAEAWISTSLAQTGGTLDGLTQMSADQVPAPPAPAPAAAAAASSSSAPAAVQNAPPPAGGGFFAYGIQAQLWQNAEKGFVASQIRDVGFTWVKSQLRWEFVENGPGVVNWSEPDQIVEVMNGNGLNILFSIFTAPQWTRPDKGGTGGPPNDFNLYADFVGKVAQRYCGRLGAIEIWNEQNLQREWEGFPLDPALYMDLLRRAYTSIKANCPSILVISGAPTPSGNSPEAVDDVAYLNGMYANGLARYSDGVGVHPSGFANPPEVTVQDWQAGRYTPPPSHFDHRSFYFRSTMEEYRNVMVNNGDLNKRLWPTEFGWGSSSIPHPGYEYEAYITESAQAQYIVRAYLMMRDWGWVGVPFLWNLNFTEGEMSAFRVVGRPAYDALKSLPK